MKKKCLALVTALLMISLMIVPSVSARALTFIAVNNNFSRNLSPTTIPVRINGNIYVPYSMFRNVGNLKTIYNSRYDQVIIYNSNHILTFDITNQLTYDELGSVYSINAIRYNSTVYVPAYIVCECFSYNYSYITSSGLGPVLRIVTDDSSLSDDALLERELTTMRNIYNDYQALYGDKKPSNPGTSSQPVSPTTPSTNPSADPGDDVPSGTDEPAQASKAVYLAFEGPLSASTASILDQLARQGFHATFFVPSGITAETAPYLARAAAEGHTIGNQLNGAANPKDSLDQLLEQAADMNAQLRRLVKQRTRLMMIPGGSSHLEKEKTDGLLAAGYRLWDPTVDLRLNSSSAIASAALRQLRSTSQNVVLCMRNDASAAQALPKILAYLSAENYDVRSITELNTPINQLREVR